MEYGPGTERQYDGYPFNPTGRDRELFARCVRNAIVEYVLNGAQAVYRFGDGRRFTFPIPEGEALLQCIHADVIAVQGQRKDIRVTVRFPCVVPHAPWSSDPFETTLRVEYVPDRWKIPSENDFRTHEKPPDAGIDLTTLRTGDAPGYPYAENDAKRHESKRHQETSPPIPGKTIVSTRYMIGTALAAVLAMGWIASGSVDPRNLIERAREQWQKIWDAIDGTPSATPPTQRKTPRR